MNGRDTSMVSWEEHVLYEPGFIVDVLCGKKFRISSKSFYQINPVQTEKLYNLAIEAAGLTGKETVVDAMLESVPWNRCSVRRAGSHWRRVGQGCRRDAVTNAKANGEKNIRFLQQRCRKIHRSDGIPERSCRCGIYGSAEKRKYRRNLWML